MPDTGDIEERIRDLGGDPAIVAADLVLLRVIFSDDTLRSTVPPGFWSPVGGARIFREQMGHRRSMVVALALMPCFSTGNQGTAGARDGRE